jgi:hypothetical protein
VKAAFSAGVMVMVRVAVLDPKLFVAVNVTGLEPAVV